MNCMLKDSLTAQLKCPKSSAGTFLEKFRSSSQLITILTVLSVVAICTILGLAMVRFLDHENVIMIYLLGVVFVSSRYGLSVSLFTCLLSVLAFDIFIIPPVYSLIPSDPSFLFSFAIMTIVGVLMSLITEQTKAFERGRAEILDITNDAISVWSPTDGKISYWNSGAERLFKIDKNVAIGSNIQYLLRGVYTTEFDQILSQLKIDGSWNGEITYQRFDGVAIAVASRMMLRKDSAGKAVSIIEFGTDISEKRNAEQRIKEFYSTVSHELRTPLTSIRGALCLLERQVVEPDSEEGAELISLGRIQSDYLMALINDLLDIQKIEAGKLELHTESLKIHDVIASTLTSMNGIAKNANVNLHMDCCSNHSVMIDSLRIMQVLTNLLSNAIKFSASGVDVSVIAEDLEGKVRISVIDKGDGLRADQIPLLFTKFKQLDSSDSRNRGGTGLGLAISKAIVEQHGGRIGVTSEIGNGSTFWLELPFDSGAKS